MTLHHSPYEYIYKYINRQIFQWCKYKKKKSKAVLTFDLCSPAVILILNWRWYRINKQIKTLTWGGMEKNGQFLIFGTFGRLCLGFFLLFKVCTLHLHKFLGETWWRRKHEAPVSSEQSKHLSSVVVEQRVNGYCENHINMDFPAAALPRCTSDVSVRRSGGPAGSTPLSYRLVKHNIRS